MTFLRQWSLRTASFALSGLHALYRVAPAVWRLMARNYRPWMGRFARLHAWMTCQFAALDVPAYRDFLHRSGWGSRWFRLDPPAHRTSRATSRRTRRTSAAGAVSSRSPGTVVDESAGSSGTPFNWLRSARELQDVHKNRPVTGWCFPSPPSAFAHQRVLDGRVGDRHEHGHRAGQGLHGQVDRPGPREDRRHDRALRPRLRLPRHRLPAVPQACRRRARRARLRLDAHARLRAGRRRGHDRGDARLPRAAPRQGPLRLRRLATSSSASPARPTSRSGCASCSSRAPTCARRCSGRARSACRWCSSTTRSRTTSRSTTDGEAVITVNQPVGPLAEAALQRRRRGADDQPRASWSPLAWRAARARLEARRRCRSAGRRRSSSSTGGATARSPTWARTSTRIDVEYGLYRDDERRRADRELLPRAPGGAPTSSRGRSCTCSCAHGARSARTSASGSPRGSRAGLVDHLALGQPRLRRVAARGPVRGRPPRPAARPRHRPVRRRRPRRSRTSTCSQEAAHEDERPEQVAAATGRRTPSSSARASTPACARCSHTGRSGSRLRRRLKAAPGFCGHYVYYKFPFTFGQVVAVREHGPDAALRKEQGAPRADVRGSPTRRRGRAQREGGLHPPVRGPARRHYANGAWSAEGAAGYDERFTASSKETEGPPVQPQKAKPPE